MLTNISNEQEQELGKKTDGCENHVTFSHKPFNQGKTDSRQKIYVFVENEA